MQIKLRWGCWNRRVKGEESASPTGVNWILGGMGLKRAGWRVFGIGEFRARARAQAGEGSEILDLANRITPLNAARLAPIHQFQRVDTPIRNLAFMHVGWRLLQ